MIQRLGAMIQYGKHVIEEDDIEHVNSVLKSQFLTQGPVVGYFETAVASYCGAKFAISSNSATSSLHLAMLALDISSKDLIWTSAITFVATSNAALYCGGRVDFLDIDKKTLNLDVDALSKKLEIAEAHSSLPTLLVVVHLGGAPVDMDPIRALALKHGIQVVEDAAHALGTSYKGKPIGSSGTAVFSFQAIKNVTAAEGGLVTSDDEELAARIRRLRFFGLAVDAFDRSRLGAAARAEVQEPGLKYNMADMNAALVLSQLTRLSEINARRDAIVTKYREGFADVDEIRPLEDPAWDHVHARHLFVVRIEDSASVNRDEFMDKLKEFNIGTGVHFIAVHTHRWYREHRPVPTGSLPNTEWNSSRICSLPLFPDMTDSDVDDVVAAVKSVLAGQAVSTGVSS